MTIPARDVTYDNTKSQLVSKDVQDAIDELNDLTKTTFEIAQGAEIHAENAQDSADQAMTSAQVAVNTATFASQAALSKVEKPESQPNENDVLTYSGQDGVNVWKNFADFSANTPVPYATSAPGKPGQMAFSDKYLYICVDENTWRCVQIFPLRS